MLCRTNSRSDDQHTLLRPNTQTKHFNNNNYCNNERKIISKKKRLYRYTTHTLHIQIKYIKKIYKYNEKHKYLIEKLRDSNLKYEYTTGTL